MVLLLLKRTMAARSVQAAALVAARPMVTSSPAWLGVASKFAVKLVVCVGNATFDQEVVLATRFIAGAVKLRFKAEEPVPVFPAASVAVAVKLCAPAASAAVV